MSAIERLDREGLRKFGLVTGAIVLVLFGFLLPWIFGHGLPRWPWYIAGALWVPALLLPDLLKPVYIAWMRFGMVLGWINTRIILGILFYILFTPTGLLLKVLRVDAMRRKLDARMKTYRVESRKQLPDHMERPF
ncbi:SxtJ family membrane protein [Candidatus Thiosymbion oneisti]|uniref:SxtJ family membrane protein n=1 Tax=Candidatus Thiosymbion oneisti TaxID=589554 RepID=UPI000A575832|nr:SxtJ family membrane protein [Candidatus Thiosymbion oneisti]